jgi:hypothetical protein
MYNIKAGTICPARVSSLATTPQIAINFVLGFISRICHPCRFNLYLLLYLELRINQSFTSRLRVQVPVLGTSETQHFRDSRLTSIEVFEVVMSCRRVRVYRLFHGNVASFFNTRGLF